MIRNFVRGTLAVSAISVGLATAASASAAITGWGSSSSPLTVTTGGKSSGQAYGNVWTYGLPDKLYNSSYQRDLLPNGHGVTVKSKFSWYNSYAESPVSPQTKTSSSSGWTFGRTDSAGISTSSAVGRVTYQLCEVYDWSPDNCTVRHFRDVAYK